MEVISYGNQPSGTLQNPWYNGGSYSAPSGGSGLRPSSGPQRTDSPSDHSAYGPGDARPGQCGRRSGSNDTTDGGATAHGYADIGSRTGQPFHYHGHVV